MLTKLLILILTVNTALSQMLLKRAALDIGLPHAASSLRGMIGDAALSPWLYGSIASQAFGYVLWMMLVAREKLGIAAASVGAGFYVLLALSAWLVYGETLTLLQWAGILLITFGVVCISLGQV